MFVARLINNAALTQLHQQVQTFPLPSDAQVLLEVEEVGLQSCCSNHCDFFVGKALLHPKPLTSPPSSAAKLYSAKEAKELWSHNSAFKKLWLPDADSYLISTAQTSTGFAFELDHRCH